MEFTPVETARAKVDLFRILDLFPDEADGVLGALRAGQVDGQLYEGDCSCLIGTIARLRGDAGVDKVLGVVDPGFGGAYWKRCGAVLLPAERWFAEIREGDTPEANEYARIAAEWILEWIEMRRIDVSTCSETTLRALEKATTGERLRVIRDEILRRYEPSEHLWWTTARREAVGV